MFVISRSCKITRTRFTLRCNSSVPWKSITKRQIQNYSCKISGKVREALSLALLCLKMLALASNVLARRIFQTSRSILHHKERKEARRCFKSRLQVYGTLLFRMNHVQINVLVHNGRISKYTLWKYFFRGRTRTRRIRSIFSFMVRGLRENFSSRLDKITRLARLPGIRLITIVVVPLLISSRILITFL